MGGFGIRPGSFENSPKSETQVGRGFDCLRESEMAERIDIEVTANPQFASTLEPFPSPSGAYGRAIHRIGKIWQSDATTCHPYPSASELRTFSENQ
jgi:hypothetical protein